MRDLLVSAILIGLMPACFRRPFVGLCVFTWMAYMRVQDLTWGFAREVRWSFYISILMLLGFFLQRDRPPFFRNDPRNWAMIGLAALVGISVLFSVHPDAVQLAGYMEFLKIVVVALFTTTMVRTREQLRIILWIVALSLGFFGVKSGIWGFLTLGQPILHGPGGLLHDSNDFSLALAMAVPMLFCLGITERNPQIKKAFWFAVPLTFVTVGLTRSRGGFLAVVAAVGVLVWRSRNRLTGILVGVLIAAASLTIAPKDYVERIQTIANPTQESSAQSRLVAWGIATRMAQDNPVFGVGFRKFRQHYHEYNPDAHFGGRRIVAHSSYFQVWAECGTPALLLYLFLIGSCLWTCWRLRKMARARYYTSWIANYAVMFEAVILSFCVGATFLNRAHFDLFYHLVGLVVAFAAIAREEMARDALHPERATGRGSIRSLRRPGFRPAPSGASG